MPSAGHASAFTNKPPWHQTELAGTGGRNAGFLADQYLVTRALDNFLSNARRYANSTIQTTLRVEDRNCIIMVDDDGPGIPEEDRAGVRPFHPAG
jgi:pyridoxal/pyridoxine/pyridoxamine kinase